MENEEECVCDLAAVASGRIRRGVALKEPVVLAAHALAQLSTAGWGARAALQELYFAAFLQGWRQDEASDSRSTSADAQYHFGRRCDVPSHLHRGPTDTSRCGAPARPSKSACARCTSRSMQIRRAGGVHL